MGLSTSTWLIISALIFAAYIIALKLSRPAERVYVAEIHEAEAQNLDAGGESAAPARPAEEPGPMPQAAEQGAERGEEREVEEVAASIEEELRAIMEPQPESVSEMEVVELEREIEELRALLAMSAELKKEVERLAELLKSRRSPQNS